MISAATELRCAISISGRRRGLMLIIAIGSRASGIDMVMEFVNLAAEMQMPTQDEKAGR